MSSEKFEALEEDIQSLINKLLVKVEQKLQKSVGEVQKMLIADIESGIYEASAILQEMDIEARGAPVKFRPEMITSVRGYRDEVTKISLKLKQGIADGNLAGTRHALFGAPGTSSVESETRKVVIEGKAILEKTSESLVRSQQVAAETDQVGTEIIEELGEQRESLIKTRQRLTDTDVELGRSRRILRSMYRRVITNKVILIFIILVELLILTGVVIWKFFS